VSSVAVGDTYSDDQGQSTKDVAKDQAGNVKDTAVQQGQQVAGVAKEQAGAVKDTAVQQGQHVAGVAKDQAGAVKDTALEQGQHVAEVAKEQVGEVASEATAHVKDLLSEGLSEIRSQAGSQQKRAATAIHSLADELGTMASKSDKTGPLTDYAKELSRRGGEAAHWLENAEPSEVLDSLRSFARRRPALFLASSALAGVVVGRLTRGFVANKQDEKQPQLDSSYSTTPGYATTDYTTTGYSTTPQYTVDSGAETPYSQDVPATGTGYGYTTDAPAPGYDAGDPVRPYGTTGNDGVTR
jgi:gas vesicle protein